MPSDFPRGNGFLAAKGLPGLLAKAKVLESPNLG